MPELMISMALLALIMVAAALAVQAAAASHAYNSQKGELVARARGVLDRIAVDVRKASSVEVVDARTLDVTLASGWVHTYSWDGDPSGTVVFTDTDPATFTFENPRGTPGDPVVLTGFVQAFEVQEAGEGGRVRIALRGTLAASEATISATPGKVLW